MACGVGKKLNPILDEISGDAMDKGMRIGKVICGTVAICMPEL